MKLNHSVEISISMDGNDTQGSVSTLDYDLPVLTNSTMPEIEAFSKCVLALVRVTLFQEVSRVGKIKTFSFLNLRILCKQSGKSLEYFQKSEHFGIPIDRTFDNTFASFPLIFKGMVSAQILDVLTNTEVPSYQPVGGKDDA